MEELMKVSMDDINISNIVSNYYYLEGQKIIADIPLQNALFGFYFRNADVLKEQIQDHLEKYQSLPGSSWILNVESSPTNLMNLRDFLVFLKSTVDYYQNNFDVDKLEYVERNSKRSIIQYQKDMCYDKLKIQVFEEFPLYRENPYSKYLEGCIYSLLSFLKQFDESYFWKFIDGDKHVTDFFDSLETVKKWDSISDEIQRYASFYQEIVGKILYSSLSYLKSNGLSFDSVFQEPFHDSILEMATNFSYEKDDVYQKTIELFPNAFSILDDASSSISEVPMIDYSNLLSFLTTINSYRNLYYEKKDNSYLLFYYRNIDFFLRHILNIEGYESFSLFDFTNTDYLKMQTYLLNLIQKNRDSIIENTLSLTIFQKYPISNSVEALTYYKSLKKYYSVYDFLQSRFSISISALHHAIAKNSEFPAPFLQKIISSVENLEDTDPNFKEEFTQFVLFQTPSNKKEEILPLIRENIDELVSSYYVVSKLDEDILYSMNIICLLKEFMGDFYE